MKEKRESYIKAIIASDNFAETQKLILEIMLLCATDTYISEVKMRDILSLVPVSKQSIYYHLRTLAANDILKKELFNKNRFTLNKEKLDEILEIYHKSF